MAPPSFKKRKVEDGMNGRTARPKKKFKKQRIYHSSSEDEGDRNDEGFTAVNLQDSDSEKEERLSKEYQKQNIFADSDDEEPIATATAERSHPLPDEVASSESDSYAASSAASASGSNIDSDDSISGTDQPRSTRHKKLESRALAKLRAEKREVLERGRIRDVLGVERGEAGETAEQEKRLRKIAQRGVIKLFNAMRAAQVRGEELVREERRKRSIVGMAEREKAVNEVSKQVFLDLINGKGGKGLNIEEA
ncbi:predicted protein [Histoplasma mississippiense (nom. inval.)]|uniref:rRNA processing protein RRP15 n=1 Tax=Ajellomyces capsulatus (strain NAm1 / WU24) TaxID=2059318 RepID=UPI000157B35D|nr:rRNA processing protein RRP15 [Histoplasma mississippiense (nom. inval.)]EDN02707.1 predicted protein [Histoplasma mississippiense (nom. inval.)]